MARSSVFNIRFFTLLCLLFANTAQSTLLAVGPPATPELTQFYDHDPLGRFQVGNASTHHSVPPRKKPVGRYAEGDPSVSNRGVDQVKKRASNWYMGDGAFINKGKMPWAGASNYEVWRDVTDPKFAGGAKGDGVTDDSDAINAAISYQERCGAGCSATTTKGAVIWFPGGRKYLIRKPIIQYYYTQFIGDPDNRPTIMGSSDFNGIALIDTNVYMGGEAQWYINQNNFYRQIRNFIFDMSQMPNYVQYGAQSAPNGIHWQVAQACSLQNLHFQMPTYAPGITHTGIFMENGSGGFVSDLTFSGGAVGWKAGNQQFTARNLQFSGCDTAIQMIWDWGFLWKNIRIFNSRIGIDCTSAGTIGDQGTGSITVLDSLFSGVQQGISINAAGKFRPNIVLDNVELTSVTNMVGVMGGEIVLGGGSTTIASWVMGRVYDLDSNRNYAGTLTPPVKASNLINGGKYFEKSKPQYETLSSSDVINILDWGVANDGSVVTDNHQKINNALQDGANRGKVVFFPAGIYRVLDTINVPVGSKLVGSLWPQIMAHGDNFYNPLRPHKLVKVGNEGDTGTVQISDFIFTQSGPTSGVVLMEWNIKENYQGSAGMWDCIFRVGGAAGTALQVANCPKLNMNFPNCAAAALLFRMTPKSSAYLENMWFWVADHDIDDAAQTKIDVYAARSVLIESEGPTWIHSASSEHATLYQWNLAGAKNIYLGHIQSETPYFQATIPATSPYGPGGLFPHDPSFSDCSIMPNTLDTSTDTCLKAWALRIISSQNVYLYGAGLYSFFKQYATDCATTYDCQDKIVDTSYSTKLWLYELFTVGSKQVVSPQGNLSPFLTALQQDNQNGFATAVAAWLVLVDLGATSGNTIPDAPSTTISTPTSTSSASPTPTPTPSETWLIYMGSKAGVDAGSVQQWDVVWTSRQEYYCGSSFSSGTLYTMDDVTLNHGWNCDGCQGDSGMDTWDITRLEMYDNPEPDKWRYSVTEGHLGYLTAYKQPDGTYELVSTLEVGGQFTHQGTCVRPTSPSHEFTCAFVSGKHLMTCTSWYKSMITW